MSKGNPVVTPTRQRLIEASGLKDPETISRALTKLHKAGWIERVHVPKYTDGKRTATLLRIFLKRMPDYSRATDAQAIQRHKPELGYTAKNRQDFPKGKGVVPGPLVAGPFPTQDPGPVIPPDWKESRRISERKVFRPDEPLNTPPPLINPKGETHAKES